MDNFRTELLQALIKLSGKTSSDLAKQCGMAKTNFSAAINNKGRPFPKEKLEILLDLLGIPEWKLDSSKVHNWHVSVDIDPLIIATSSIFRNGAKMEVIWREGNSPWDLNRVFDNKIFALTDGKSRVIINRSGISLLLHLNPKMITPTSIPHVSWKNDEHDYSTIISLDDVEFNKWQSGDVNVEEFDQVWNKKNPIEDIKWDHVIRHAELNHLSAKESLEILKQYIEKNKL